VLSKSPEPNGVAPTVGSQSPPPTMAVNNNNSGNSGATSTPTQEETKSVDKPMGGNLGGHAPPPGSTNENKLYAAKDVIPFLKNEEGKVLEFWLIWAESIPTKEEQPGINMDYHIATSANLQKLTWRTSGPQNAFIQKMVDFFYNVGAPDSEIDRLNDIGSLINPLKIGSWIDMSANGGMDGGWFFPG